MAKNDFQYGGWKSYTLQCGTIITLISPGDCTLQCGMWLWDAIEFAQKSAILELYTSPQSTCHSAPVSEILSKSDHHRQKKMTSFRFSRWRNSAILDFMGPVMGSWKSPCTTCMYRSSIDHSSKLLNFWENRIFAFWRQTDEQTNKQTNRWTAPLH